MNSKEICIDQLVVQMIVSTPIKNANAIKNAITKKIVPKVRQTHATHSQKIFLPHDIVIIQQVVL